MSDFVRVSDGRIGIIVASDRNGGVFKGHNDIWFGEFKDDGTPKIEQLCVMSNWATINRPMGESP